MKVKDKETKGADLDKEINSSQAQEKLFLENGNAPEADINAPEAAPVSIKDIIANRSRLQNGQNERHSTVQLELNRRKGIVGRGTPLDEINKRKNSL